MIKTCLTIKEEEISKEMNIIPYGILNCSEKKELYLEKGRLNTQNRNISINFSLLFMGDTFNIVMQILGLYNTVKDLLILFCLILFFLFLTIRAPPPLFLHKD